MVVLSRMRIKMISKPSLADTWTNHQSWLGNWRTSQGAQAALGKPFVLNMRTTRFVDMTRSSTTGTCAATTITNWVKDISAFIKSTDCVHLVAIGDEGFYKQPSAATEPCQCVLFDRYFLTSQCRGSEGIDFEMPTFPLARLTLVLST